MNNKRDYQKDWNDFWKEIVCDKNGNIDLEQLKKELSDYSILIENVPTVYCHVTGGELSYPTYNADVVIEKADQNYEDMWHDIYKDDITDILKDGKMDDSEKLNAIKEYID